MPGVKKADFLEYWTDATGRVHIVNVFCKGCGEKIQEGRLIKNHLGTKVPMLTPLPNYVDLYIAFEDKNGTLKRKSTPMCAECAKGDFSATELEAIHEADTAVAVERHKQSGVRDKDVEQHIEDRKRMKMMHKIGVCVQGYAIVGEGR